MASAGSHAVSSWQMRSGRMGAASELKRGAKASRQAPTRACTRSVQGRRRAALAPSTISSKAARVALASPISETRLG